MDRGVWQALVHGVTESDMTERLSLSLYHRHIPNHTISLGLVYPTAPTNSKIQIPQGQDSIQLSIFRA